MLRAFRHRRYTLGLAALFAAAGLSADWHAVAHEHVETELHAAVAEPTADHVERPESVGHGTPTVPACALHSAADAAAARLPTGGVCRDIAMRSPMHGGTATVVDAGWRLAPKHSPPIAA
jgi:hypothetical protein